MEQWLSIFLRATPKYIALVTTTILLLATTSEVKAQSTTPSCFGFDPVQACRLAVCSPPYTCDMPVVRLEDIPGSNLIGWRCGNGDPSNSFNRYCQHDIPAPEVPDPKPECPAAKPGSIVHADSLAIGEVIPIVDAPFDLYYFSDRVIGRVSDYKAKIAVTGPSLPPNLTAVVIKIELAGRTVTQTVNSPAANQFYTFTWDGFNSAGVFVNGPVEAKITTTRTYSDSTLDHPISWKTFLGNWKVKNLGLGGWVPSNFHFLSRAEGLIYFGSGGTQKSKIQSLPSSRFRVANNNTDELYIFDANGRHLQTLHGLTGAVLYQFSYDPQGRLSTITDYSGNVTTIVRNSSTSLQITGENGKQTSLTLNGNGYLSNVTNPNSESHLVTYYGTQGLLATFTKPGGQVNTFSFDGDGFLTNDSHSAGAFLNFIRGGNATTRDITMTTALNRSTLISTVSYQASSQRMETAPDSTKTKLSTSEYRINPNLPPTQTDVVFQTPTGGTSKVYRDDERLGEYKRRLIAHSESSPGGYLTTQIQQSVVYASPSAPNIFDLAALSKQYVRNYNASKTSTSQYVSATRKTTTNSAEGRVSHFVIRADGQLSENKFSSLSPVTLQYDSRGRLVGTTQSDRVSTISYNSDGRIGSTEDAMNNVTAMTYDSAGRVVSKSVNGVNSGTFGYDLNGNLISVTPPTRAKSLLNVNDYDLFASYYPSEFSPIGHATQLQYNADKQLTKVIRPGGTIDYNYNVTSGRLTSLTLPNGTQGFFYNTDGTISYIQTPDGVRTSYITYSYGAPTQERFRLTSTNAVIGSLRRSYNTSGLLQEIRVYNAAETSYGAATYSYDNDDLMTQAGAESLSREASTGFLASATLGQVVEEFTYDPTFGELSSLSAKYAPTSGTAQTLRSETYQRDKLGRITERVENDGSSTKTYVYSYADYKLSSVQVNGALVGSYAYDGNGNLVSGTRGGVSFSSTVNAFDQLQTFGPRTYSYQLNGDLASVTDNTDPLNPKTTTYTYDVLGNLKQVSLPNGDQVTYVVDALGRRLQKKANGVLSRTYVWQSGLQIAGELDANGAIKSRFVYGSKSHVPSHMVQGSTTYKFVTDHLGSVRLVVNAATGAIAQRLAYDEFGKVTQDTNPGFQPFGFAGGLYDPDTKLVRFGARDYDAETARWTSRDPILFAGGDTNLYGYVLQDPVNLVDPSGLEVGDWWDLPANFGRAREIATEELARRPNSHNDLGDAMRHAEWNRRMAQETNSFTAWVAGTGHELQGLLKGQPWSEMLMDLHNNRIGRNSGSRVNQSLLWTLPLSGSQYNPYRNQCGGK